MLAVTREYLCTQTCTMSAFLSCCLLGPMMSCTCFFFPEAGLVAAMSHYSGVPSLHPVQPCQLKTQSIPQSPWSPLISFLVDAPSPQSVAIVTCITMSFVELELPILRITPFTCYSVCTCSCIMLTSQMGETEA